jgi:hypothetical protein
MITAPPLAASQASARYPRSDARNAGLAYLGLAICGLTGTLLIRKELYEPGDAARTVADLVRHEGLARLGIAVELGSVLSQALVAVAFFVLFRSINAMAAASITVFGMVNATVMLLATAFSATALHRALSEGPSAADDVLLLYELQDEAWRMGGLFFGLWLLPMGWLAWRSGWMPRLLGWGLLAGGAGYVLSTFTDYLVPDASWVADVLLIPATPAELWMVGYLLFARRTNEKTSQ